MSHRFSFVQQIIESKLLRDSLQQQQQQQQQQLQQQQLQRAFLKLNYCVENESSQRN
jgi:hypothetical protein